MAGGQVQVGNVQIQTDAPNPLGGVLAGVNSGADWAAKSQELEQRSSALDVERQKIQASLMKNRLDVGQHLYDRIHKISKLPLGAVKENEIELLGNDMGSLGMSLHPSAVALMKDKNLSQNLYPVLESLNSSDPEKHVAAMSALPYLLSDEKVTDFFLKRHEELGKNNRSIVAGLAQVESAKVRSDTEKFKTDAHAALENTITDKKLTTEEKIAKQRTDTEKTIASTKLAAELAVEKRKSTVEVRKESADLSKDFQQTNNNANAIYTLIKKPSGMSDTQIIKAFNGFNDTKAVREGEVKFIQEGAPLVDRARQVIQGWVAGTKLTDGQRADIVDATKLMHASAIKAHRERMQPLLQQVQDQGIDVNKVFSPLDRRVLGIEPAAAPAAKSGKAPKAAAPATAGSQPAAVPAATQVAAPPASPLQRPIQLSDQALQAAKAYINTGTDMATRVAKSIELEVRKGFKFTPQQRAMLGLPPAKGAQ